MARRAVAGAKSPLLPRPKRAKRRWQSLTRMMEIARTIISVRMTMMTLEPLQKARKQRVRQVEAARRQAATKRRWMRPRSRLLLQAWPSCRSRTLQMRLLRLRPPLLQRSRRERAPRLRLSLLRRHLQRRQRRRRKWLSWMRTTLPCCHWRSGWHTGRVCNSCLSLRPRQSPPGLLQTQAAKLFQPRAPPPPKNQLPRRMLLLPHPILLIWIVTRTRRLRHHKLLKRRNHGSPANECGNRLQRRRQWCWIQMRT
mmetsp:Transcript_28242/g.45714  ORF Transcript_28242/g.45714 Transcript_28242/m.45714 type:complete len:254 (+) Transcript_28242:3568-4329(+)